MSTFAPRESWVRTHPRIITAMLSIVGYALVAAAFLGKLPFPTLGRAEVVLFSDLIAAVNTVAVVTLVAGWRFILRGNVRYHMMAMSTAFGLILLFLILYIWKQAGGFTKSLVVSNGQFMAAFATPITYGYWVLLGVHVLLSILAVPLVLHAIVLGLTQPTDALENTAHPTVGRIAVATWTLSLTLGIVTYWMLNHVYGWEAIEEGAALLLIGWPRKHR